MNISGGKKKYKKIRSTHMGKKWRPNLPQFEQHKDNNRPSTVTSLSSKSIPGAFTNIVK